MHTPGLPRPVHQSVSLCISPLSSDPSLSILIARKPRLLLKPFDKFVIVGTIKPITTMDPVWLNNNNITGDTEHNFTSNLNRTIEQGVTRSLEATSPSVRNFLVVLYSTTSVCAFVGNVIVVIVETYGRRSAANLRKFLINLAISDILFGVFSVPFTYSKFMNGRWVFFPWLCPWAQFVQILSIFITSFTLTVISVERYYAILYPLSNPNKWLTRKSLHILIIGWLLGILWAAQPKTKVVEFEWNNNTYIDCRPDSELSGSNWYNVASFLLTFGIPLLILSFCYLRIIRCLLSTCNNEVQQCNRNNNEMTKQVIRMLVAVVIVFFICWLPIRVLMTILTWGPSWLFITNVTSWNTYVASYFVCHWMAMANSFCNPIIYSFMSKSFRADFSEVFGKLWHGKRTQAINSNDRRSSGASRMANGIVTLNESSQSSSQNYLKKGQNSTSTGQSATSVTIVLDDHSSYETYQLVPMRILPAR